MTTLKRVKTNIKEFVEHNAIFVLYLIISLIGLILIRGLTVGHVFSAKAFTVDFALVMGLGSLGYLMRKRPCKWYLFSLIVLFTLLETINSVYFTFYHSFFSLGELSAAGQTETVLSSVFEKVRVLDVIYLIQPFLFIFIHRKFIAGKYPCLFSQKRTNRATCISMILISGVLFLHAFLTCTGTDYSRLAKQWNRCYIVERFGLILYHGNDLIQTITPHVSSMFGHDEAIKKVVSYFEDRETDKKTNEYTDIFKGKNLVIVHMEGIETFLMDLSFSGVEATPTINQLAREGMFFKNFYPQVSIGTSSDTEFTLNTSLMPVKSGAVFTNYYDRTYNATPKILKEMGYETFSMHGNHASMWNRAKMHPVLGYNKMYFEDSFKYKKEDVLNLGINDKLFFKQAVEKLEKIEDKNEKYMGTVITLSNHSPFTFTDKYGEYDLSEKFSECQEVDGEQLCAEKETAVGNYIKSAHYADSALGDFIDYVKSSDHFNNTVFVFYGDHDVKLSRKEKNYLYNYNKETGKILKEGEEGYVEYDSYAHELNKKTPLIIWTKDEQLNKKINKTVEYYTGMIDVQPTLGNMFGFSNEYALGHDIFDIKDDNFIAFPNGNVLTNKIYYNNNKESFKVLNEQDEISRGYVEKLVDDTSRLLDVSNDIIIYNLLAEDLHSYNMKCNDDI